MEPTKMLVRLERVYARAEGTNERGSPWYIAGLEKWFRRRGNRETPKCSLRFGWRRIAFPRIGWLPMLCASAHTHTYIRDRHIYSRARLSPDALDSRFALSLFASSVLRADKHAYIYRRGCNPVVHISARDYCESRAFALKVVNRKRDIYLSFRCDDLFHANVTTIRCLEYRMAKEFNIIPESRTSEEKSYSHLFTIRSLWPQEGIER